MLKKFTSVAAGALLACLVCSTADGQTGSQQTAHATATTAPIAKGLSLSGASVDPLGQGGTVVLIFMRTDCPVSNRYAPTIKALGEQYAGKARFFLVYPDRNETRGKDREAFAGIRIIKSQPCAIPSTSW